MRSNVITGIAVAMPFVQRRCHDLVDDGFLADFPAVPADQDEIRKDTGLRFGGTHEQDDPAQHPADRITRRWGGSIPRALKPGRTLREGPGNC